MDASGNLNPGRKRSGKSYVRLSPTTGHSPGRARSSTVVEDSWQDAGLHRPNRNRPGMAWHPLARKTRMFGWRDCERLVALENALAARSGGKLTAADHEELALAVFRHQSEYHSAKVTLPEWRKRTDQSLPSALDQELDRARCHREQSSYGALTLHALRGFVGSAPFALAMDAFGRANDGKEIRAGQFFHELKEKSGKDVEGWLTDWRKNPRLGDSAFSTAYWLDEPESAVIVYGTTGDVAANREAANALQNAVRVSYGNVIVPVKADADMNDLNLAAGHVILVGRPTTNSATKHLVDCLPVSFGPLGSGGRSSLCQ